MEAKPLESYSWRVKPRHWYLTPRWPPTGQSHFIFVFELIESQQHGVALKSLFSKHGPGDSRGATKAYVLPQTYQNTKHSGDRADQAISV